MIKQDSLMALVLQHDMGDRNLTCTPSYSSSPGCSWAWDWSVRQLQCFPSMSTSSPSTICGLRLEGKSVLIFLNAFHKPFFYAFLWSDFERKIPWQWTCCLIKQCVKYHNTTLFGIYSLKMFIWLTWAPVFKEKSVLHSLNNVIYDFLHCFFYEVKKLRERFRSGSGRINGRVYF